MKQLATLGALVLGLSGCAGSSASRQPAFPTVPSECQGKVYITWTDLETSENEENVSGVYALSTHYGRIRFFVDPSQSTIREKKELADVLIGNAYDCEDFFTLMNNQRKILDNLSYEN